MFCCCRAHLVYALCKTYVKAMRRSPEFRRQNLSESAPLLQQQQQGLEEQEQDQEQEDDVHRGG
eukprot:COSAG06_NODE_6905_length_2722_cov_7.052818_1_plen_63_part_10